MSATLTLVRKVCTDKELDYLTVYDQAKRHLLFEADGADALAKRYAAVHERLAGIYPANASFSDTCAALRERRS